MTVVTHHPIVIQFESIFSRLLAVDIYLAILNNKVILFIHPDRTLVYSNVLHVKIDALPFCRNPYRPVVIRSPAIIMIQRIKQGILIFYLSNTIHKILVCLKGFEGFPSKWHTALTVKNLIPVFIAYAQLVAYFIREHLIVTCIYSIVELNIIRLLLCFTVYIYHLVLNLQRLARQTYTSFYIILSAICRAADNLSISGFVSCHHLFTYLVDLIKHIHLIFRTQSIRPWDGTTVLNNVLRTQLIAETVIIHRLLHTTRIT